MIPDMCLVIAVTLAAYTIVRPFQVCRVMQEGHIHGDFVQGYNITEPIVVLKMRGAHEAGR
jgi:hypothetical protein